MPGTGHSCQGERCPVILTSVGIPDAFSLAADSAFRVASDTGSGRPPARRDQSAQRSSADEQGPIPGRPRLEDEEP